MHTKPFCLLLLFYYLIGCQNEKNKLPTAYPLAVAAHFLEPVIPSNNPLTVEAVELGKRLFSDPILSKDSSISCQSCHLPKLAFADSVAISPGVEGHLGFRNAPTLMNTAWLDLINKDGGVAKLDMQAMTPIEDHDEMGISVLKVAKRLNQNSSYVTLAQKAYGRPLDPFVITRSLASYLRTLISDNSSYDQYLNGNETAMTEAAIRGKNLFFGEKTNCSRCHSGFNLTNNQFENNGLYEQYKDNGRQRVTLEPSDEGKFRIPTLRNVALTAPYMHDGSIKDLKSVINHYNRGGKGHHNQNELIRPLNLTEQEQEDLLAFLEALTDNDLK
ncbi:MAG: cytochrome c peroxidase [Bacteroidota bacterium]